MYDQVTITPSRSLTKRCALGSAMAGVLLGCACALTSTATAANSTIDGSGGEDMKCKIDKQPTARGFQLSGVVWSETAAPGSGRYRLSILKEGASGRSSSMQEGLFALEPGEEQRLSTVSVSVGRGDNVNATLVIVSEGEEVCFANI
ncbi:curli-like amyloid fiber formation chaperone CsgH [Thalassorhabdomicrobium marinisediminis]|uniref:Uncharacterized protein n=1 Tax=Thalassorhabdomicrobium marinisediminis TaxID=2170577 RepID=A0A2T7FSQ2_9RHOB|nr:curli-like amyloid fiber formation chaperone CsgH [Thalassorhabdomicrobium marinisediminis]PVA05200.1 hypothetical protein DC363_16345 [Thalassorhabdomicrobium marinisediminis]